VSLSWLRKKPLRIGLGAKRVIITGAKAIDLPAGDDWRAALDALPEILKEHHGRDAQVVLADQFVRYALLPHNEAVKTSEQWLALARHRFGALHGAAAAAWEVKVTETSPLGPRLAVAVDRDLIEALANRFLVAAFNRIRQTVGNGSCWIVVEEPGRLTLALIRRGAWVAIRSRRADERWRLALPEILEREGAFLGLDEPCTRVIVCAQGEFDVEMHDAWRAQALSYRDLALAWE
jgi:hypothetical protein